MFVSRLLPGFRSDQKEGIFVDSKTDPAECVASQPTFEMSTVRGTFILVAPIERGSQLVVYENQVLLSTVAANEAPYPCMILPFPFVNGCLGRIHDPQTPAKSPLYS